MYKSIRDEFKFLISKKRKAFYIGWHGYGNLGDEALLFSIKNLLNPKYILYEKKYIGKGVRTFLRGKFDILILGGGTLINNRSYLEQFKHIKAKKKIVFGTGTALPEFWQGVKGYCSDVEEWIQELNHADYIGVRGPLSLKLLEKWGIKKPVNIIGDPALFLSDDTITRKKKAKILGVNLGFTKGFLWGGNEEIFFSKFVQQLRKLGQEEWSFKFFPVMTKDIVYIKKAMEILSEFNIAYTNNFLSLDEFFHEMRSVDIFVGEKLHSVVLATCTHTPSIMLEYRPKCLDFMMSLDLEKLTIRTDQLTHDNIIEKVKTLYANLDNEQESLFEKTTAMKKKLVEAAISIINIC